VLVRCGAPPCVELTANPNPTSACPGDPITISGTVKNCSTDSETIVVTVAGTQVFNQVVPVGATAAWTTQVTMPQCTAGAQSSFTVQAVATNRATPPATSSRRRSTSSARTRRASC
jgi:hypothetical protein